MRAVPATRRTLLTVLEALLREYAVDRDAVERDLLALAAQLVARRLAVAKPNAG